MTNEQVELLCKEYFDQEGYQMPDGFEHRVDPDSLRAIYSFVRKHKPTSILQIGCWEGGTTLPILGALLKNGKEFNFVASELLDNKRELTEQHAMEKFNQSPTMIGDITECLDDVPEKIDFLFHDSDHDLATTEWVMENIFPRLTPGALVIFHDWAVEDKNDVWVPKDGCWPETTLLCDLHNKGELKLKKVYWNYNNPHGWETGVFTYEG